MTTMAYTFEELCESLHVDENDYDDAWTKICREADKYGSIDAIPFEEYPNFLTENELTALVRLEHLDRHNSGLFGKYALA